MLTEFNARLIKNGFGYEDLKALPPSELNDLASEIRSLIAGVVEENGGHLGSSLGMVELSVALLRRFDPL